MTGESFDRADRAAGYYLLAIILSWVTPYTWITDVVIVSGCVAYAIVMQNIIPRELAERRAGRAKAEATS